VDIRAFRVGDRVKLSELGRTRLGGRRLNEKTRGTVTSVDVRYNALIVLRDGIKTRCRYSADFWERAPWS
jgi:hypothetical protein